MFCFFVQWEKDPGWGKIWQIKMWTVAAPWCWPALLWEFLVRTSCGIKMVFRWRKDQVTICNDYYMIWCNFIILVISCCRTGWRAEREILFFLINKIVSAGETVGFESRWQFLNESKTRPAFTFLHFRAYLLEAQVNNFSDSDCGWCHLWSWIYLFKTLKFLSMYTENICAVKLHLRLQSFI